MLKDMIKTMSKTYEVFSLCKNIPKIYNIFNYIQIIR